MIVVELDLVDIDRYLLDLLLGIEPDRSRRAVRRAVRMQRRRRHK
jgi:hypothetical protein